MKKPTVRTPKIKQKAAKTGRSKSRPRKPAKPKSEIRDSKSHKELLPENAKLRRRLAEAEETLNAIRTGDVDALVVSGPHGEQIYALKGAEQPYRVLVESMNEGALTIMENGSIINCNKAFAEIAGTTCGMLIGRNFKEFVSEKDKGKFEPFWKQACETEVRSEFELAFDGRKVPVYISARARMIEGESWVFVVVTDISERKRNEAELEKYRTHLEQLVDEKTEELQAMNEELLGTNDELAVRNTELEMLNKELDAFVYSVSHDLRAPLRVMEGFVKIVSEDYADKLGADARDYLARIRSGSERMTKLIGDLLGLSRVARQNLDKMDYNLSSLVSAVVMTLRQSDPARNTEVIIAKGLRDYVDPNLMKIAFLNILGNAWKFTSKTENAKIEFGAIDQGGKIIYFVKDNGVGFDPTYMNKMFLPFQRLHSEQEFEGTGIGLAIVERIIRKHGGKVWAEGAVGKGATIYFSLYNDTKPGASGLESHK